VILAQGVSQAIITTIFGLIVAIPCMVFYAYFRRRVSRMVALLEIAATEIMTLLITRPRA
jgi:biopolymer transport protein ExbB